MKRKALLVFALFSLAFFAHAEVFYWLRGNDVKTTIDGGENFFISGTAPNSSSSPTEIIIGTKKGRGFVGKWYSTGFSETFLLSGKAFLVANKFKHLLGKTTVGFSLYEFDEETGEETLIVSSGFEKPVSPLVLEADFGDGFIVGQKKRLKLVLEYIEESGSGKISFTVDEGVPFKETILETPTGVKARAMGADGTAVLVLDACLDSGIECTADAQCSDQNNFTLDTCNLPGTCKAECVRNSCTPLCASNSQCSDNEPLTFDACEHLGFCNSFCTNNACTSACISSTDCGDSNTLTLDTCMYAGTCVSACRNTPCSGENCTATEKKAFCGDNVCHYNEECPADCVEGKSIGLLGYRKENYFVLGEEIVLQVKPIGFGTTQIVTAKGFFGETTLLDDGKGKDEKALDGVFSGPVTVPSGVDGATEIVFTIGNGNETIEITADYIVAPVLELLVSTERESYNLGDIIQISGQANKKGQPLSGETIFIEVSSGGKTVSTQEAQVNGLGFFEAGYRTSFLEDENDLEVAVSAKDSFGNTATASQKFFSTKKTEPVQKPVQNPAGQKNPPPIGGNSVSGGETIFGFAQKNYLIILAALLAVAAVGFHRFLGKEKIKKQSLKDEEKKITGEMKEAQELYFKKGLMSRKDYDEKMLKLEGRLSETRKKLGGKTT